MPRKPELETALEDRCVAKVEALGGMALKLAIPGARGFPDRTLLFRAKAEWTPGHDDYYMHLPRVAFAEFKRLKTGRPSVQQLRWKRDLEALGFKVFLVDTDAQFDSILEEWR